MLKKVILVTLLSLLHFIQADSQTLLLRKVDTLKQVLSRADTLSPFDNSVPDIYDTITFVNEQISKRLSEILTLPECLNSDLNQLLKHPSLGIIHSSDKRLWIFTWYENTGGSWRSNANLIHYRTKDKRPRIDTSAVFSSGEEESPGFCHEGASFQSIYKLRNTGERDLYLCLGNGVSCNTCEYHIASIIELTNNGINLKYRGFGSSSCKIITSRRGNVEEFDFDPVTQIFTSIYLTDDYTPIERKGKQIRVVEKLLFKEGKFTKL
jgi:hypothetical protein